MAIVIFDLDGTLTKKDTYLPFLWLCLQEFGPRWFSIFILPFYVSLYLCGLISNSRLKEIFLDKILSGIPLERLEPVSEKFVSELLDKGLNKKGLEKLQMHLKRNDKVILASASFDFYAVKLAKRLGIDHIICTRAEVKDEVLTGRILGENCYGWEKVRRLEAIISDIEWGSSLLYTDHYADLPLLKRVAQGFLVNPNLKTRVLLRQFQFNRILEN